jgi:hypothetical protein
MIQDDKPEKRSSLELVAQKLSSVVVERYHLP